MSLRVASTDDFVEDLILTVRELLTQGLKPAGIRRIVTRAVKLGPFTEVETPISDAKTAPGFISWGSRYQTTSQAKRDHDVA